MSNKGKAVIDAYVNSVDIPTSSQRLLEHVRRTQGDTWNMEAYRIGGGEEKIPQRRFRYLRFEAQNPALYREEVEFLTNLSGMPLLEVFDLPDINKVRYDEATQGLAAVVGSERIDEIKNNPDITDP